MRSSPFQERAWVGGALNLTSATAPEAEHTYQTIGGRIAGNHCAATPARWSESSIANTAWLMSVDFLQSGKMTRRADILRRAGEALYGERWQSPLSRDLVVTDRTIRNWAAGRNECPDDVPEKLLHILRARGESVAKLTSTIEQQVGSGKKQPTGLGPRKKD